MFDVPNVLCVLLYSTEDEGFLTPGPFPYPLIYTDDLIVEVTSFLTRTKQVSTKVVDLSRTVYQRMIYNNLLSLSLPFFLPPLLPPSSVSPSKPKKIL